MTYQNAAFMHKVFVLQQQHQYSLSSVPFLPIVATKRGRSMQSPNIYYPRYISKLAETTRCGMVVPNLYQSSYDVLRNSHQRQQQQQRFGDYGNSRFDRSVQQQQLQSKQSHSRCCCCCRRCGCVCHMALIPIDVPTMERIVSSSGKPTGAQYATYWGRTMKERYGRTIESATVGFLGVFFSYFLSFIVGGFVATILGSLFFFWGILSPELKAYQRNWEFLGGRSLVDMDIVQARRLDPDDAGLYGGLFVGHIEDVCVVEDSSDGAVDEYDLSSFSDYTMETDELDRYTGQPYLLRVRCTDQLGRTLQIHTRLSEDYLCLKAGMPSMMLLLSTSPTFTKLAALTDIFVLTTDNNENDDDDDIVGCWIGDYPYLDRIEFEALLTEDDELWDALLDEAVVYDDETKSRNSNVKNRSDGGTDDDEDWNKVLIPAKGRRQR